FEVYQEEQEKQIRAGQSIHEWSCNNIEEANRYAALRFSCLAVVPMAILMIIFSFIANETIWTVIATIVFLVVAYASYLTMGLDYKYRYVLSEQGLVQKKNRNEPEWVNKAMVTIAWVCSIGCVFAVAIAGPMALAGSGILILLAFGMTKRKPQNDVSVRVAEREDWVYAKYNVARKVIALGHRNDECFYLDVAQTEVFRNRTYSITYLFFATEQEILSMVEQLEKNYDFPCQEVQDKKHLFDIKYLQADFKGLAMIGDSYSSLEAFELRESKTALPEPDYFGSV
uniref:hypothetical protein n=1 Tax=Vibrio mexicanus TaxID=1004326 RepID=UPI00063C0E65